MADNDNEGRTFIDDLFDKADAVMGSVEKFADGGKIVIAEYSDGSKIVIDEIAGSDERTGGEPNWLHLRFFNSDGKSYVRRYNRRDLPVAPRGVIDLGAKK